MKKFLLGLSACLFLAGALFCLQARAQYWYPGLGPWLNTQNAQTGAYAAVYNDCGTTLSLGGAASYTLTIGAPANYPGQCTFVVVNTDASQTKTLAVSGMTTQILQAGQIAVVFNNLGAWQSYFPLLTSNQIIAGINSVNRLTSNFAATSTTTLANSGLSANFSTTGNYTFHAWLPCDGTGGGGCKFSFAASGGLTTSSIEIDGLLKDSAVRQYTQVIAFATAILSSTAVSHLVAEYNGTIVVTATGSLNVQFAQASSNANASILNAGAILFVYGTTN